MKRKSGTPLQRVRKATYELFPYNTNLKKTHLSKSLGTFASFNIHTRKTYSANALESFSKITFFNRVLCMSSSSKSKEMDKPSRISRKTASLDAIREKLT